MTLEEIKDLLREFHYRGAWIEIEADPKYYNSHQARRFRDNRGRVDEVVGRYWVIIEDGWHGVHEQECVILRERLDRAYRDGHLRFLRVLVDRLIRERRSRAYWNLTERWSHLVMHYTGADDAFLEGGEKADS